MWKKEKPDDHLTPGAAQIPYFNQINPLRGAANT
jgi:hypothetical protein